MASAHQPSSISRIDIPKSSPRTPDAFPPQVDHAPGATATHCSVTRLQIRVTNGSDGKVSGFLHTPTPYERGTHNKTAAILLSGAGGGVTGPSSMYLGIADKLASLPKAHQALLALRLDYRFPARNKHCVPDVQAAIEVLKSEHQIEKIVLVGWSFGSAPVLTCAAQDPRVIGAALVAPQTAETEGLEMLPPRPLLLCHGLADRTLSPRRSRDLERRYRNADSSRKGEVELTLFDGDDHALTLHAAKAERQITEFMLRLAGVESVEDVSKTIGANVLPEKKAEKVRLMKEGGDLKGGESVE
ncbi:hypothetical protein LTR17_027547 [Elasticomyces elasticus]|nr:hypothetical protein LTR17_027547 [Elasticomyces elasticus]